LIFNSLYPYETFYYGQPAAGIYTGDPLGTGIPTAVNLLIDDTGCLCRLIFDRSLRNGPIAGGEGSTFE
jgi:hypothetical protein